MGRGVGIFLTWSSSALNPNASFFQLCSEKPNGDKDFKRGLCRNHAKKLLENKSLCHDLTPEQVQTRSAMMEHKYQDVHFI